MQACIGAAISSPNTQRNKISTRGRSDSRGLFRSIPPPLFAPPVPLSLRTLASHIEQFLERVAYLADNPTVRRIVRRPNRPAIPSRGGCHRAHRSGRPRLRFAIAARNSSLALLVAARARSPASNLRDISANLTNGPSAERPTATCSIIYPRGTRFKIDARNAATCGLAYRPGSRFVT